MDLAHKTAVETYQCPGCVHGSNIECRQFQLDTTWEYVNHHPATFISHIGKIFLGLPTGFNRLGDNMKKQKFIFFKNLLMVGDMICLIFLFGNI